MTTTIYDNKSGTLATDSRWSTRRGRFLTFVDDTGYNKLVSHKSQLFMFAGKGNIIDLWKQWVASNPVNLDLRPPVNGISVCIVNSKINAVVFSEAQQIDSKEVCIAGSGSEFAFGCWSTNLNAMKAVETAKELDCCSGGEVKFFDCLSGENNLKFTAVLQMPLNSILELNLALLQRGHVMDMNKEINAGIPFKLSELSAADGLNELNQLKSDLESGKVSADAPCLSMHSEWKEDRIAKLDEALAKVFGWNSQ